MAELNESELCPCGRGAEYGKCCKPNGITWSREGDQLHRHYTAVLPQEALDGLEKDEKRFTDLFGRKPSGDDLIFFAASKHGNESFRQGLTFLRNLGLPEEWKYAYYRTGGLMPTQENEKYLSKHDLDLFRDYCQEYKELMGADPRSGKINALLLTSLVNKRLESACDIIQPNILSGFEYFLNTVSDRKGSIVIPPNSLKEYASFIAIRTIRALRSIRMLGIDYQAESIHTVGRSLFECYVYLKNINNDAHFFSNHIYPILNSHDYGFEISAEGINYKKMHISKALNNTKRKRPDNLYQLNYSCGPEIDRYLYDYYYRPACQFVHIDAFTARCCFYEEDIYTEFDPALVAMACTFSIAILVLEQLADLDLASKQQVKDIKYLTANNAFEICDCLSFLVIDPEQCEEEYQHLLNRLKMVKGNQWNLDHG